MWDLPFFAKCWVLETSLSAALVSDTPPALPCCICLSPQPQVLGVPLGVPPSTLTLRSGVSFSVQVLGHFPHTSTTVFVPVSWDVIGRTLCELHDAVSSAPVCSDVSALARSRRVRHVTTTHVTSCFRGYGKNMKALLSGWLQGHSTVLSLQTARCMWTSPTDRLPVLCPAATSRPFCWRTSLVPTRAVRGHVACLRSTGSWRT